MLGLDDEQHTDVVDSSASLIRSKSSLGSGSPGPATTAASDGRRGGAVLPGWHQLLARSEIVGCEPELASAVLRSATLALLCA